MFSKQKDSFFLFIFFQAKPSPSVAVLPALLAKSSICYNPIIYAGLNAQFPRSLKKILGIRDIQTGTNGSQQTALTTINKQEQKHWKQPIGNLGSLGFRLHIARECCNLDKIYLILSKLRMYVYIICFRICYLCMYLYIRIWNNIFIVCSSFRSVDVFLSFFLTLSFSHIF